MTLNVSYLILDLDDTIYPISTFPREVSKPFFKAIEKANDVLSPSVLEQALEDSWFIPFFDLAQKYQFTEAMIAAALNSLATLPKLEIEPFPDYKLVRKLNIPQYLVTSGMTTLQKKKVEALAIGDDFLETLINDPFEGVQGGKKSLFQKLISIHSLKPESGLVVGDNVDSELAAAYALGIPTVLIDRLERYPQVPAWIDYQFQDFEDMIASLELGGG